MQPKHPQDLGKRVHLIDGFDLDMPGRTGTYVIREEQLTLVETGPSPSVPHILAGLKALALDPTAVKYIIVTHIHLDHAGGAGRLLESCPNATVVVHPRGARHLADPTRLIQGSRAVFGDKFDRLFQPIVPIPEDRLLIKEDGETLSIGDNCQLRFLHTLGHSAHHFSIHDPVSNGIFTGDTAGVRYHQTEGHGFTLYLPSTTPNQFDPEAMHESIQQFRDLAVERIYFGHYGMTTDVSEALDEVDSWIPHFVDCGEKAIANGEGVAGITQRLETIVRNHLDEKRIPKDHEVFTILKMDMEVCAMGIADYLDKKSRS